jgi:hypothetical protein
MAVLQREYLFSVNKYNEPTVAEGKAAIALMLIRLILLDPGSDPLHPQMGVGIKNYRYAFNQLEELRVKIEEQIQTYLPEFQNATVVLTRTEDKLCNIEITINDVVYVYDSATAPIAISLEEIQG